MKYSKQQTKAIEHMEGPALVLAVPGAGKTTVLLARINNLIKKGINPNQILAMTFSKTQANDMKIRYSERYGNDEISFSTIHSFAYKIVRTVYKSMGKNLNLIESSDQVNRYKLIQEIYYKINGRYINEEDIEDFFRVAGFIKNTLQDYEWYKKMYGPSIKNFQEVFQSYEQYKHENDLIDFDDMLVLCKNYLQKYPKLLESVQNTYTYIQIDEGQDTSLVQLEIIKMIARPNNNLFIVADDDQSIYGFRGADSKSLLEFKDLFAHAKVYFMEENYRSSKNIVRLSDKLIKNNLQRYNKNLHSSNQSKDNIDIIEAKNSKIQTNYVANQALKDLAENKSVAIIYRNNSSLINFINVLNDKTPFYIKETKLNFYKHFIFKDLFDIINFFNNLHDVDLFEKVYYKFNMFLKKDFIREIKMMDSTEDVIERLKKCSGINYFYEEKIDLLSYYAYKIKDKPFNKKIDIIFGELGYIDYLKELSRRMKTPIINFLRIMDTIKNIGENCQTSSDFISKLDLLKNIQQNASLNTESKLTLTTIHGSKGLEYDSVYFVDLIQDEFPSAYSVSAKEELGVLEEERRLFYVGMTRAKNHLTLINCKYLMSHKVKPSMFLNEITRKNKK